MHQPMTLLGMDLYTILRIGQVVVFSNNTNNSSN